MKNMSSQYYELSMNENILYLAALTKESKQYDSPFFHHETGVKLFKFMNKKQSHIKIHLGSNTAENHSHAPTVSTAYIYSTV